MAKELDSLIEQAAAALRAAGAGEVYVFGSAAAGKLRDGSDVDLAVSGLAPEVFFQAMGAASRILRRPLDLVDLDEDNPFLKKLRQNRHIPWCRRMLERLTLPSTVHLHSPHRVWQRPFLRPERLE